jgi:hypothetical protein
MRFASDEFWSLSSAVLVHQQQEGKLSGCTHGAVHVSTIMKATSFRKLLAKMHAQPDP